MESKPVQPVSGGTRVALWPSRSRATGKTWGRNKRCHSKLDNDAFKEKGGSACSVICTPLGMCFLGWKADTGQGDTGSAWMQKGFCPARTGVSVRVLGGGGRDAEGGDGGGGAHPRGSGSGQMPVPSCLRWGC